jgi:hypothetical protein
MLASAGIDASSSGVYPNASATSRTAVCSDDKSLDAIEPYLDRTARSIFSDIFSLHLIMFTAFIDIRIGEYGRRYSSVKTYVKANMCVDAAMNQKARTLDKIYSFLR